MHLASADTIRPSLVLAVVRNVRRNTLRRVTTVASCQANVKPHRPSENEDRLSYGAQTNSPPHALFYTYRSRRLQGRGMIGPEMPRPWTGRAAPARRIKSHVPRTSPLPTIGLASAT